jgi:Carboxypeptidase regulatory-like domain
MTVVSQITGSLLFLMALAGSASSETIWGTVVEDHSGAAVGGAGVRVFKAGTREAVADLDTDGEGRFRVPPLAPGEYRLDVSKRNYIDARVSIQVGSVEPRTSGQVFVRLIRCGVISGQVADQQGQPVTAAYVYAMPKAGDGRPLRELTSARVDERGEYRLFDLPPGQYAVAATYGASTRAVGLNGSVNAQSETGSGVLFYPNEMHPQFLAISGGEEYRNIDFTVTPSALTSVSGGIENASARGQFWLALTPAGQPALAAAVTHAQQDGSFRFVGIPAGSYYLFAAGPVAGRSAQGAILGAEPLFGRTSVEVSGQPIDGISLALEHGRSVAFVLHFPHGETGGACPRSAQVRLASLEDWGVSFDYRTEVSAGGGSIEQVAPGRYHVDVADLGERCYSAAGQTVDLSGGADSKPVEIPVAPAGEIRGRLTGATSAAQYAVVLLRAGQDGDNALRVSFADGEGRFGFAGLHPGSYRIAARLATKEARWIPDLARMIEISVPGGAPTDVELPVPKLEKRP